MQQTLGYDSVDVQR